MNRKEVIMKFSEFKYTRPDLDKLKEKMQSLIKTLQDNVSLEASIKAVNEYFDLTDDLSTQGTLVSIRNSIDTRDEFYEKEQEFFNQNMPEIQNFDNLFKKALLASKFRSKLEEKFGSLMFLRAELEQKTFDPKIIPLLQKENTLGTEYQKLLAGAEIKFDGKTYNLSQMAPFFQKLERETRHQAQLAVSKWFESNEDTIDRIYDDMVKVRAQIAKELGYDNYIQLGYDRLGRTDYGPNEVETYRAQIKEDVVPLVTELTERKANRIDVENPKSWDLPLAFKTGNPVPQGDRAWQVDKASKMYKEMSPETNEFFEFMKNNELLELDAKPGKSGGGYCTFIPEHNTPFIFANFNGTSHDVDVLTHEAGHAFQVYQSRNLMPEYRWPTMEAAEIHSMSMEFLAWPWIHYFFEKDTEKYKFNHLAGAVTFLPYGALVDHFQHEIYAKPEMTPAERKATWRKLEKEYLPFKDYGDDKFLDKGTYWYRQGHIFGAPFYYIDYTLAQVLAFQYFVKSRENHQDAFQNYLALCKLGGSQSFVHLVQSAGLNNPF